MPKSDIQLQHDVLAELSWEPKIDPADVGVSVHDGVVSLWGFVKSYPEKLAAEAAVRRVAGVRALAEEVKIRFPSRPETADHEIARRIADVFEWDPEIPGNDLSIKVDKGWVTLAGSVDRAYQREEAKRQASRIIGVSGLTSRIAVKPGPIDRDLRDHIRSAFQRQAEVDADAIEIELDGTVVRLCGKVRSMAERRAAERVIAQAQGVTAVHNGLEVTG